MHDKKVIAKVKMNVNMFGIVASGLVRFHQAICNALSVSIEQQEAENLILKARIKELENALNMGPLLMTPLAIRALPSTIPTINTSHGSNKSLKLVNVVIP